MTRRIFLAGLDFDDLTAIEAAERIAARPRGAPFRYVVTPNADHLARLAATPPLAPLYHDAFLCLLDSRVVARLARLRGRTPPRVATGADLAALLLARHIQPGEPITLIGPPADWLPALTARFGLARPFHHDPPRGFEHDPAAMARAVDFVVTHPARLVFLAVGSPRQELLAAAIAATGRAVGTGLCIGAGLAFLAGAERRAPVWVRHAGLEWAFRLACQPRRLARRYLLDSPRVLPLLWR